MSTTVEGPIAVQRALNEIGWPIDRRERDDERRHRAVADFQRGFAWWHLLVDGYAGPKTRRALEYCLRHDGRCSQNFTFVEFASRGNDWIRVRRELVVGLEELRELVGPIPVTSGYRDPKHNADVGGAANSQHLYGNACDPGRDLPLVFVRSTRRFSGIGIRQSDGTVQHVDVRHLGPNTTNATITDPTIWFYN